MSRLLASAAVLLAAALTALALVPSAQAARRTCPGTVTFSGTSTKLVVLRGTTCATARRVVRSYDRGTAPRPWACALARAPFDTIGGRRVGFSCGSGASGDLRKAPHAFVGTIRAA